MQLWLGLMALGGVLGAPAVAGIFQLRAGQRERAAQVRDEKAATVQSEAVDVYALLQASIVREAAEKDAHAKTKRQLRSTRRELRECRASKK